MKHGKTPGSKFPDIATEYGNCVECGERMDTFLFKVRHGKCVACWEKKSGPKPDVALLECGHAYNDDCQCR